MDRVGIRRLLTPELIVLLITSFVFVGLLFRTSSGECHHWKDRLTQISGAFLAAAGEKEYPTPGLRHQDREGLHRATQRLLDNRPFGCI